MDIRTDRAFIKNNNRITRIFHYVTNESNHSNISKIWVRIKKKNLVILFFTEDRFVLISDETFSSISHWFISGSNDQMSLKMKTVQS